jgi:hypothetical protein
MVTLIWILMAFGVWCLLGHLAMFFAGLFDKSLLNKVVLIFGASMALFGIAGVLIRETLWD